MTLDAGLLAEIVLRTLCVMVAFLTLPLLVGQRRGPVEVVRDLGEVGV